MKKTDDRVIVVPPEWVENFFKGMNFDYRKYTDTKNLKKGLIGEIDGEDGIKLYESDNLPLS